MMTYKSLYELKADTIVELLVVLFTKLKMRCACMFSSSVLKTPDKHPMSLVSILNGCGQLPLVSWGTLLRRSSTAYAVEYGLQSLSLDLLCWTNSSSLYFVVWEIPMLWEQWRFRFPAISWYCLKLSMS